MDRLSSHSRCRTRKCPSNGKNANLPQLDLANSEFQTVIAAQAALPDDQADVGSGFVTFSLFFGGSIFVALGETIFINQLGPALKQHAAVVPADVVIEIGATGVRKYFHGLLLQGVILAYNQALTHAFVSPSFD